MKKNSQKRKFGTILLSLAALFAVLFSTAACKTDSDDDELNSVTISPSEATINANGQTSLYADVDKKGSGTPVYKWEITSGDKYATLEKATSVNCVVTGKNTTTAEQEVTVKVTAAYDGTTKEATTTVKILAPGQVVENKVTSVSVSAEKSSIACDESTTLTATAKYSGTPTITYTWTISEGGEYAELSESTTGTATLTAKNTTTAEQTVTVKVSASDGTNSVESTCAVTVGAAAAVETGNVIKASDTPLGFAGVNYAMPTFTNVVTVKTRNELMSAIKNENSLIYIDGMIDMSDEGSGSKLPAEGASNIAVSSVMDSWIASKTSNAYKTYAAWVEAYAAVCEKSTDDKEVGNSGNSSLCKMVWTLNNAWKLVIQLNLKSNTTIIGLGNNSGIRGGTISINGIKNVVIRNLTLVDAIDMFPHHEVNSKGETDGFNAQFDCITIQGSNTANIWIDHCTMKDTLVMQHVLSGTKEKWQNYDGLCDIKGTISSMTVSYCKFMNHDKTMLLCSGTSDTGTKNITLAYNYFYGCKQRLPMVGIANLHIFNNYFAAGDGTYSSNDYAIGLRYSAQVVSENNSFSSWIKNAYKDQGIKAISGTSARLYSTGDSDSSQNGNKIDSSYQTSTRSDLFAVGYSYSLKESSELETYIPANAGAGVWTVVK